MRVICLIIFVMLYAHAIIGQDNCTLYEGDCRIACELSTEASKQQGSKRSQILFDSCIALCPTFAYAYYQKAVPYLKHGLIPEWKKLIDKAVELEPQSYLVNRGCNQIQFFRNYQQGINDLNKLEEIYGRFDIGYSNSGQYHAQMLKALAYRELGESQKAIDLMEKLLNSSWYRPGLFDYLHLGASYLKAGYNDKAIAAFSKQNNENELAETYYYLAQIAEQKDQKENSLELISKSIDLYKSGFIMSNNYYQYLDKIYFKEIESVLKRLNQ